MKRDIKSRIPADEYIPFQMQNRQLRINPEIAGIEAPCETFTFPFPTEDDDAAGDG